MKNPFFNRDEKEKSGNIIIDILQSIVIAVSISIFLYLFILTPNEVDGPSMLPNFETGDLLFTSKLHQWFNGTGVGDTLGLEYERGDVVVFQKPGLDDFVKRIVGLPGDEIRLEDGEVYINGERYEEQFDIRNLNARDGEFLQDGGSAKTIPRGNYILLGDNRDVSYDSRVLGFIREEWIKGRVVFRFWPLNKFGYVGTGEFEVTKEE